LTPGSFSSKILRSPRNYSTLRDGVKMHALSCQMSTMVGMTIQTLPRIADYLDAEARLRSTLRTIDFPATKDDLLRIAVVDHLEVTTIDAIRELPGRDFHGMTDVLRELGAQAHSRILVDSRP
jgi:hypothetical protein